MNKNCMVSILCATYNHEPFIAQAIGSFLKQKTSFPFEIIVHDDASSDNTAGVIRSVMEENPGRIRAIFQTENQYSKGVNVMEIMLDKARGKYIALCEGDDLWSSPDKLEKQIQYMEANPDCALSLHAARLLDVTGRQTGLLRAFPRDCVVDMAEVLSRGGALAATSSYVYRAELRRGPTPDFFRTCFGIGDTPLQLYLATKGYIYYFEEPMSCYRQGHPDSWTARVFHSDGRTLSAHLESCIQMLRAFDGYSRMRWHDAVEAAVTERQLVQFQADREFLKILRLPYRKGFLKLPLRRKIRILAKFFLDMTSPTLYRWVLNRRKIV